MRWLRTGFVRLGELFRRKKRDEELAAEIESHVQMHTDDNLRAGMDPVEARRQALIKFGGMDATVEAYRERRGFSFGGTVWQDFRYAVRVLRKSPGFTAVTVLTLALGIGANTAIFSLINAIMLRTLPVRDPQSLFLLKWNGRTVKPPNANPLFGEGCPGDHPDNCWFSYSIFQQIEAQTQLFSGVLGFLGHPDSTMKANGRIISASGLDVTGGFFSVLGVQPALGRLLVPADDSVGAPPVVVISYRFWQNVMGGNRSAIGQSLLVGNDRYTIVGVTVPRPLQLDPGLATDFWLPLSALRAKATDDHIAVQVIARLKRGVSIAQATPTVSTIFAASPTVRSPFFLPNQTVGVELLPAAYGKFTLRREFSRSLYVLLAAVGLVLLIACANISGLMLARTSARRRDIAVRAALGASRGRIIRQLLTESLVLSLTGGILGTVVGAWGAQLLARFLTRNLTSLIRWQVNVHPDFRVLIFTLLVSMMVGVGFGLLPAFSSKQVEVVPALKEGASGVAGASHRSGSFMSNIVVVIQMALAMLVLAGTGLLVRTFTNLKAVPPGFDPRNLLLFSLDTTYSNRTGVNRELLYNELQQQLTSLPGVTSASYSGEPLLSGIAGSTIIYAADRLTTPVVFSHEWVGPDFFQTMRIPLLAGRVFDVKDIEQAQSSQLTGEQIRASKTVLSVPVVINENMAHVLFGSQPALGRFFFMAAPWGPTLNYRQVVVGVVGNTKHANLRDALAPTMYRPQTFSLGEFEVRTALDPKVMMPAIRAAIHRFDPNLLITDMKTQEKQIDQNIYQERLVASLSSLFALLALVVACVGIYGLLSYQVTRRTHEIGIRLALGAQRGDVLRIVLRQGIVLAVLGTLIGTPGALAVTRYLQSFLYGVKPSDPLTMVAVAVILIAVALLASYIPARRAMKTDPMVALRYE